MNENIAQTSYIATVSQKLKKVKAVIIIEHWIKVIICSSKFIFMLTYITPIVKVDRNKNVTLNRCPEGSCEKK
jgi:ABC-type branched-subunit amino acid transport system ATPase component